MFAYTPRYARIGHAIMHISPLIVTLGLDADTFTLIDTLRTRYFPPDRNIVPAHVSLFHYLPGEEDAFVLRELRSIAADHAPLSLKLASLRRTGRGMAVSVESSTLKTVRGDLARVFSAWLTPQDRQPFQPHVTLMNKSEPYIASLAFQELRDSWSPRESVGESLLLWEYLGGPWSLRARYPFTGESGRVEV